MCPNLKTYRSKSFIASVLFLLLASCGKDPQVQPSPPEVTPPPTENVYIAGTTHSLYFSTAVYWLNGKMFKVGTPGSSSGRSIAIDGKDVYVAGKELINNVNKAVYWKNGNRVILGDGEGIDIAVQNGDVYVAGYVKDSRGDLKAAYWKNGVSVVLKSKCQYGGCDPSFAMSIALKGNDVHIAGFTESPSYLYTNKATYWKNNDEPEELTPYGSSHAWNIWLDGNDVYIAGFVDPTEGMPEMPVTLSGAVYWKNGVAKRIFSNSPTSVMFGIATYQSKVYVTGSTDRGYYAEDGNVKYLTGSKTAVASSAIAITVYKGDVYVCGDSYNSYKDYDHNAGYWKNGSFIQIGETSSQASDIVVVDVN